MTDPRDDAEARFTDHRNDDVEYVGATMGGAPMFFDSANRSVFEGEHDEANGTVVADGLEHVAERFAWFEFALGLRSVDDLDWDSLSAFARERIKTDGDD